ncbi:MAG: hypothetical protein K2H43_03245, partial [Clostridia bacterium]|nr:hypothetical protein [Clostridia bacterium]
MPEGAQMDDTMSGLSGLLNDIYEKTGVRVRTEPHGGCETGFSAEYGGKPVSLWTDGAEESTAST